VIEVDPGRDPRWEEFLRGHSEGLVYHHPAWLQVLAHEYDRRRVDLACVDVEGRVHGVLPLVETRGLPLAGHGALTGTRLSSLPRTPLAGPVATSREATSALLRSALEHARARPGMRLQLKPAGTALAGHVDGVVETPWRATYVLDLPADPADLRFGNSRNHARIRWAVNKAAKESVTVREADAQAELRDWYRLYLDTMRRNVVPPRPFRLFAAMWELMRPRGLMRLVLAEQSRPNSRRMLAGSIFLMFGETVFYAFSGVSQSGAGLRPNDLIQWHAIHDACVAGHRRYDLGEVSAGNVGLAEFKRKWGAREVQLHRYYHPAPGGALEAEDSNIDSAPRRLANAAWRRMPLRATAAAGDFLYRYL
jgi:hypothetical protein